MKAKVFAAVYFDCCRAVELNAAECSVHFAENVLILLPSVADGSCCRPVELIAAAAESGVFIWSLKGKTHDLQVC